jgi:uncharacterized protein YnzC (UPF0291/DUF896 family)
MSEERLYRIGEAAELLGTSSQQLRRWEREGLIPPPSARVQRGKRMDRRYTQADLDHLKELRWLFKVGAPTAEEAAERERRRREFLPMRSSRVQVSGKNLGQTDEQGGLGR